MPGDGSTVSGERPIGVCKYICMYFTLVCVITVKSGLSDCSLIHFTVSSGFREYVYVSINSECLRVNFIFID